MQLKHIKGIGPAKQAKLNEAGIQTVHDLAHADLGKTADSTGISPATLKAYQESAVALTLIEDVRGIGPGTVKTLAESGVASLKDLYEASSEWLAAQAKVADEKARQWQADARTLAERVAADAKTPEGRQKLAHEGKELATRAAQNTRKALDDLLATAQRDGESAIAKAKDLREKAPGLLQEYRQKAEAALRDAEAQVKKARENTPESVKGYQAKAEAAVKDAQAKIADLRAKTEEFVRTETEKVRAANDGFLRKIRARLKA